MTTPSKRGDANARRSELDRVLRAISHPLRRRILEALVDEPGSATSLAESFGLSLGTVSYHLNKVLAEDCDLLRLIATIPHRGGREKFYTLKPGVFDRVLPDLIGPVLAALGYAPLDTDSRSADSWALFEVDRDAWHKIHLASSQFDESVEEAISESDTRPKTDKYPLLIKAVVAITALRSISLDAAQSSEFARRAGG